MPLDRWLVRRGRSSATKRGPKEGATCHGEQRKDANEAPFRFACFSAECILNGAWECLRACWRRARPSSRMQPMETAKASRALVFGDGEPVPGSVCDGGMGARWGTQRMRCYAGKYLICNRTTWTMAEGLMLKSNDRQMESPGHGGSKRRRREGGSRWSSSERPVRLCGRDRVEMEGGIGRCCAV